MDPYSQHASSRYVSDPSRSRQVDRLIRAETAKICLANRTRPERLYAHVPVRQEDLDEMIMDDWRRLQAESAGNIPITPLFSTEPGWGRSRDVAQFSTFPSRSKAPSPRDPHAMSCGPNQDSQVDAALWPKFFDSDEIVDLAACGHPPVIIQTASEEILQEDQGEMAGDSESETPTTPAFGLYGWLDDLRELMRRQPRPVKPHFGRSGLDPSPVIHDNMERTSMLVTIVEADELSEGEVSVSLGRQIQRPRSRRGSRPLVSDLESIEELDEVDWTEAVSELKRISMWDMGAVQTSLAV